MRMFKDYDLELLGDIPQKTISKQRKLLHIVVH